VIRKLSNICIVVAVLLLAISIVLGILGALPRWGAIALLVAICASVVAAITLRLRSVPAFTIHPDDEDGD